MDLAWEVPRCNRKAVSTKTKIWNSTKLGRDRTNSIKWPQIRVWNCSEPRPDSDLRKRLFSLSPVPLLHAMTLPFSMSLSALLLHEIRALQHCFIPKPLPWDQGREAQSAESVEPPQPEFNHLSHSLWMLMLFAPCRKQTCFETFMRLRKRENTSNSMYCVFRNRLWTVPWALVPWSWPHPRFSMDCFFHQCLQNTEVLQFLPFAERKFFPLRILSYWCFMDKIFT